MLLDSILHGNSGASYAILPIVLREYWYFFTKNIHVSFKKIETPIHVQWWPHMDPFEITEDVRKLSGLNSNTAANHDKLQPQVLTDLADVLALMVTLIYNASKKICLETGRLQM